MSKVTSAGIIMFWKFDDGVTRFLVGHPGGPYWVNKDLWGFPKGHVEEFENAIAGAKREFEEETGIVVGHNVLIKVPEIKGKHKNLLFWMIEQYSDGPFDSNTFMMEWPPKSGNELEVLEIDDWKWMDVEELKTKLFNSQLKALEFIENYTK